MGEDYLSDHQSLKQYKISSGQRHVDKLATTRVFCARGPVVLSVYSLHELIDKNVRVL